MVSEMETHVRTSGQLTIGPLMVMILVSLAVAARPARAEWDKIALEDRVQEVDLIVVGRLGQVFEGSERRGDCRVDGGNLVIDAILKGTPIAQEGQPGFVRLAYLTQIPPPFIICPAPMNYTTGDEGVWLLTLEESNQRYWAWHISDHLAPSNVEAVKRAIAFSASKPQPAVITGTAAELLKFHVKAPVEDGSRLEKEIDRALLAADVSPLVAECVRAMRVTTGRRRYHAWRVCELVMKKLGRRAIEPVIDTLETLTKSQDLLDTSSMLCEILECSREQRMDIPSLDIAAILGNGERFIRLSDREAVPMPIQWSPTPHELKTAGRFAREFWLARTDGLETFGSK